MGRKKKEVSLHSWIETKRSYTGLISWECSNCGHTTEEFDYGHGPYRGLRKMVMIDGDFVQLDCQAYLLWQVNHQ